MDSIIQKPIQIQTNGINLKSILFKLDQIYLNFFKFI